MRRASIAIALFFAACSPHATEPVALWDPVDPAFAGCQGACGSHVEGAHADIAPQPGAALGQQTHCPVSGAVFVIAGEHPHVDVGGHTLWFCCAACAHYFEEHRDAVLSARGLGPDGAPRS